MIHKLNYAQGELLNVALDMLITVTRHHLKTCKCNICEARCLINLPKPIEVECEMEGQPCGASS